jgi:hypothetical protein
MAGSKSNYLEDAILDHVLGGPDYVRPATVYIALYTIAPTDAGGGTEVVGGSYERATVLNDATHWPAAVNGEKSNGQEVIYVETTADWGMTVAFGVHDALAGGNFMQWGDLAVSKDIRSGTTPKFAPGDLVFTED